MFDESYRSRYSPACVCVGLCNLENAIETLFADHGECTGDLPPLSLPARLPMSLPQMLPDDASDI